MFMMGFDVWSEGANTSDYLQGCHNSPKYKKGKWKVLDDGQRLLSSLIVYELSDKWFGIGSIATPVKLRKLGWGSKITMEISKQLESNSNAEAIFLFADINPEFYQKLEFVALPGKFKEYQSSTCMVRAKNPERIWSAVDFIPPKYF